MRVICVEHKTVWGGGQVALTNLLREWQRTRAPITPTIVCPPDAELELRARASNIETLAFPLGAIEKTRSIARNFAERIAPTMRLLQVMRRSRADVILANGAFSFLASVFAAKLAHTPIVWLEHNTTLPNDALVRRMIGWADSIVAVSNAIREQFVALKPIASGKISVIYNGVEVERFYENREMRIAYRRMLQIEEAACVVGTVSRLSPEKGIDFFVVAANQIAGDEADARFLIVGDGPERARLEKLAETNEIRFLGTRDDIPELLNAMDVFVMPSLAESFGIAVVEAMACELPIVASDVGGLREIVLQKETGLCVPPRDVNALANAIQELLRSDNKRRAFGQAGRARVIEKFTLARQAKRVREVLEHAVSSR